MNGNPLWQFRVPQWLIASVVLSPAPAIYAAAPATTASAEVLFVRRVQPMLQEKCLACHGHDEAKIKGGLDLRTRESAAFGGDSTKPAFIPGQPDQSPMFLAV